MTILLSISINLLLWAFAYIFLRRRLDRHNDDNQRMERIREQFNQLIMELDQTTERNIQLIENKIEELKKISSGADREIKLLEKQKREYSQAMENYRELGRKEWKTVEQAKEEPIVEIIQEPVEEAPKEKVNRLYKEGYSPDEIAKEVNLPKGEVELIITMGNMRG